MKFVTIIAEPGYSPKAIDVYRELGDVYFWFDLNDAERAALLPEATALVVRIALTVDRSLIDAMPMLKVIATSTTGLDHIDIARCKERGIEVISLRGHAEFLEKIPSTAEETIGLMLALLRKLPGAFEDVKKGNWNPNRWVGHQLFGKTLGIVGFGRLGRLVSKYAKAFGMSVIAADPNVSKEEMSSLGVDKVEADYLFKNADIVSLHVLLTDSTIGLITETDLRAMKSTAYFINTARAELISSGALEKALIESWIAGAAVDVLRGEIDNGEHMRNSSLLEYAKGHDNLIIVPHIGGTTYEAKEATQNYIAELVKKYLKK